MKSLIRVLRLHQHIPDIHGDYPFICSIVQDWFEDDLYIFNHPLKITYITSSYSSQLRHKHQSTLHKHLLLLIGLKCQISRKPLAKDWKTHNLSPFETFADRPYKIANQCCFLYPISQSQTFRGYRKHIGKQSEVLLSVVI